MLFKELLDFHERKDKMYLEEIRRLQGVISGLEESLLKGDQQHQQALAGLQEQNIQLQDQLKNKDAELKVLVATRCVEIQVQIASKETEFQVALANKEAVVDRLQLECAQLRAKNEKIKAKLEALRQNQPSDAVVGTGGGGPVAAGAGPNNSGGSNIGNASGRGSKEPSRIAEPRDSAKSRWIIAYESDDELTAGSFAGLIPVHTVDSCWEPDLGRWVSVLRGNRVRPVQMVRALSKLKEQFEGQKLWIELVRTDNAQFGDEIHRLATAGLDSELVIRMVHQATGFVRNAREMGVEEYLPMVELSFL